MKESSVITINCRKGMKIADIYSKIKDTVKYNSNFFEITGLFRYGKAKNEKVLDEIGIHKYSYIKVLPHLVNSKYYDPERDDVKLLSNLDDNWRWSNPNINTPLSEEDFSKLVDFCDSLSVNSLSTMILGIDEIEWDGNKPPKGTYGYEKAKNTFYYGENYLSNSVIIARNYENKKYTVILSCETRFRNFAVIDKLIEFLGEIKSEKNYFAPEDENERAEWEKLQTEKGAKFKAMIEGISVLPLHDIQRQGGDNKRKVNVRKYIKDYLCNEGWNFKKGDPDERGIMIGIEKDDACLSIRIISGHNGHHIQTLLVYHSEKFYFLEPNVLYLDAEDESEIVKYFENLKMIKEHMDKSLS